ncbi:MAG: hypothetical protein IPL96_17745 [Holophagaceae bacterium]|nr:hypothetical protein [Holophagaceae bacterium]
MPAGTLHEPIHQLQPRLARRREDAPVHLATQSSAQTSVQPSAQPFVPPAPGEAAPALVVSLAHWPCG